MLAQTQCEEKRQKIEKIEREIEQLNKGKE